MIRAVATLRLDKPPPSRNLRAMTALAPISPRSATPPGAGLRQPPVAADQPVPPALALLGHDLRAGLAEVMGCLQLIDPRHLPPEAALQIARTRAATEALALVMEQALAVVLGAPAPLPLNPNRTVHTSRLLADLNLRWQNRARHAGLEFLLDAASSLPARLTVNPVNFERILANLLENALKHARQGRITLRLFTSGDSLHIEVTDQGPGFSAKALDCLFAPNCRDSTNTGPNTSPGTGMGLHIVHQITAGLGGSVVARNRRRGGAAVLVIVPLAAMPDLANPDDDLPDLAGLRVLVADDCTTHRELLRIMLVQMGAEVTLAADGAEAVALLSGEAFDLLIVDIEMPRLSGIEVIRHLRARSGAPGLLPVIAVTAYMLRANKLAISAAGADATLAKTRLCPRNLALAICRALPATASAQFHASRAASLATALPELEPGPLARLLHLAGPEAGAELLDHLIADLTAAEKALLQAADKHDHPDWPNWPVVLDKSHVLIGVAGAVGARRLQTQAEALNQMAIARRGGPDLLALYRDLLESLDTTIHFVSRQIGATVRTP